MARSSSNIMATSRAMQTLIGCGMAGLSLLNGALDVNGEGGRQDSQDACDRRLMARTVPMTGRPSLSSTLRVPLPPANLIGATLSCRGRMKIRVESSHKADRVPERPEKVQPHP
jgi:hypothetical protein